MNILYAKQHLKFELNSKVSNKNADLVRTQTINFTQEGSPNVQQSVIKQNIDTRKYKQS